MTYALGYTTEREYEDACALEARNARLAAQSCNAILTLRQADFALACMRQNADEAVGLVEACSTRTAGLRMIWTQLGLMMLGG